MTQDGSPSGDKSPARVQYHSYLLRLRRVVDGEKEVRQVYLQSIPDREEHYFGSLRELMAYLRVHTALHRETAWDEVDESGDDM